MADCLIVARRNHCDRRYEMPLLRRIYSSAALYARTMPIWFIFSRLSEADEDRVPAIICCEKYYAHCLLIASARNVTRMLAMACAHIRQRA